MAEILVLGAGRVGAAIARDLARESEHRVTTVDSSEAALREVAAAAGAEGSVLRTDRVDLAAPGELEERVAGRDLVIGAVPGPLGYETLRRVLTAGVDVVDISFFEEDPFELDELARERGCVAIIDGGVAPGLSNLLLGHMESRLGVTRRFECLVGGIPAVPEAPWEYKAPFSPIDVLAEYTRPARMRREGRAVTLPALSEVERVELPGVGRLEAFNTDGLRTLLETSEVPTLVEKTLRWPGHAARIGLLRDSGFLSADPVEVQGGRVVPLELTARLLFEAWSYDPGEADLTVMRVVVEGEDGEGPVRHVFSLLDRYDAATGTSSMARTTGYTATALAGLVLSGEYGEPGISPPERLGAAVGLERVRQHLAARGVQLTHSVERP